MTEFIIAFTADNIDCCNIPSIYDYPNWESFMNWVISNLSDRVLTKTTHGDKTYYLSSIDPSNKFWVDLYQYWDLFTPAGN